MSKHNKDILYFIFEELQDDSKALFSCLMVNRDWCETAIPILWKNPWKYYYNINYYNKYYLYEIIFSYLSDNVKELLIRNGLSPILPISPILRTSNKSLTFDYLSYCKSINVNTIRN